MKQNQNKKKVIKKPPAVKKEKTIVDYYSVQNPTQESSFNKTFATFLETFHLRST